MNGARFIDKDPDLGTIVLHAEGNKGLLKRHKYDYVIPAYLLWVTYEQLMKRTRNRDMERFTFVRGYLENDVGRMTDLGPVETGSQDEAWVSGTIDYESFEKSDWFGSQIIGIFHSHPWDGVPKPSKTDIRTINRTAAAYPHIIGGVFSSDRYITFFLPDTLKAEVEIVGRRVKKVYKNVAWMQRPK